MFDDTLALVPVDDDSPIRMSLDIHLRNQRLACPNFFVILQLVCSHCTLSVL
jgi:hypothetical protein